jgi:hypothetical protein
MLPVTLSEVNTREKRGGVREVEDAEPLLAEECGSRGHCTF